jgi:hypothetical protein
MKMKGQAAVDFVTGVLADNWREFITPICLSFIIPIVALAVGHLNIFVIIPSAWLLWMSWTSMLHCDRADNFAYHIRSQEVAMMELLHERFQSTLDRKAEEALEGKEVEIDIRVEDGNATIK